jgi:hypothetical protein
VLKGRSNQKVTKYPEEGWGMTESQQPQPGLIFARKNLANSKDPKGRKERSH